MLTRKGKCVYPSSVQRTGNRPQKLTKVKSLYFGAKLYVIHIVTPSVVDALVALIHAPEPEHPLRGELAEEYTKNHAKFMKNAEKFTLEHAEKRP